MAARKDIFGYFLSPYEDTPNHDPGLDTICPICAKQLNKPLKTISLMKMGDNKSYFYRTHKDCYDNADPDNILDIESSLINSL